MAHASTIPTGTILVVDDNNLLRRLMRLELEAAGYRVIEARDGVEALEYLQQGPVAAVISDNQMPRLNGLGLLAEIRKHWDRIPVILVSAGLGEEQEVQAWATGANAVLRKPVEHNSLLETVRHLCTIPAGSLS
jgi:CheY-like chemotaxis protein